MGQEDQLPLKRHIKDHYHFWVAWFDYLSFYKDLQKECI